MIMNHPLEREFRYYLNNQARLAEVYDEKYIVIVGHDVIGSYETEDEAVVQTLKDHELGTFLVQQCSSDPNSTLQVFHSRVHFG